MILLLITILLALLNWFMVTRPTRIGVWVTKPAVMVFLIAWVMSRSAFPAFMDSPETFPLVWFLLGLVFSLAGDVFLMLDAKFFPYGLGAFSLTHLCYLLGFGQLPPARENWLPAAALAVFTLAIYGLLTFRLCRGLDARAKPAAKLPAALYLLLASLTLYSALLSWFDTRWEASASLVAVWGAALFYFSDGLNAWRRCFGAAPYDEVRIMATYHIGQIALATAALMRFVG